MRDTSQRDTKRNHNPSPEAEGNVSWTVVYTHAHTHRLKEKKRKVRYTSSNLLRKVWQRDEITDYWSQGNVFSLCLVLLVRGLALTSSSAYQQQKKKEVKWCGSRSVSLPEDLKKGTHFLVIPVICQEQPPTQQPDIVFLLYPARAKNECAEGICPSPLLQSPHLNPQSSVSFNGHDLLWACHWTRASLFNLDEDTWQMSQEDFHYSILGQMWILLGRS